jgi:hypothetical protein
VWLDLIARLVDVEADYCVVSKYGAGRGDWIMHSERGSACVNAEPPKLDEALVDVRSVVREMVDNPDSSRHQAIEWIGIHPGGVVGCESECGYRAPISTVTNVVSNQFAC